MKIFLVPLFCLMTLGCTSQCNKSLATDEKPEIFADQVNRAQLIGNWAGDSPVKDGTSVKWLIQRRNDGSFTAHFKKSGGRDQVEAGLWGISGGIYFTLTRGFIEKGHFVPANTADSTYYDAYKALSISPSEFTYKSLSTQEQFTVKRVANDYHW